MGDCVELRLVVSRLEKPVGEPPDHLVVFRVDHHHRALAPGEGEHVENRVVVKAEELVGHVDLERRVPVPDEPRQLLPEHLRIGVRNDEVEGVVDDRLRPRAGVVLLHDLAQRLPPVLGRERDDRRGAAERSRDGGTPEVVRGHEPGGGELLDVAMAVDSSRQHELAGSVDDPAAVRDRAGEVLSEGGDPAAANPHVAVRHVRRGHHRPAPDHHVVRHRLLPPGLHSRSPPPFPTAIHPAPCAAPLRARAWRPDPFRPRSAPAPPTGPSTQPGPARPGPARRYSIRPITIFWTSLVPS